MTDPRSIEVASPIPGTIITVNVKVGDRVEEDDVLLVLEAMKMENDIVAPKAGVVREVSVSEGQTVDAGVVMVVIELSTPSS